VFEQKWLGPYESIVSILWKLVRMNKLSGNMITTQLARTSIDPYEAVAACRSEVDMQLACPPNVGKVKPASMSNSRKCTSLSTANSFGYSRHTDPS